MLVAKSALSPAARLSTRPASIGPMASSKASAHTSAIVAWTNHGRSVGAGTGRGLAANARRASAIPTSAGSFVATARMAAAASTSRVARGSSARRRSAFRRASSAGAVLDVEHAGHQRQRLEQLGGLLVGGAQARRRAVDDRHRVLDALGAPERVREDERRAERHAVVVARDVERLACRWSSPAACPAVASAIPSSSSSPGRSAAGGGSASARRRSTAADSGAPRRAAVRAASTRRRAIAASPAGSVASRCSAARSSPAGVVVHELGRAPVRERALGHPELLVDAGPHERMDEGQRTLGLEDPGRHERVRGLGGLRGVELGQRGRARQLRALEHGHRAGQARRRRRQATQAQLDPAPRGAARRPPPRARRCARRASCPRG